ncbi:MAG: glycoside hydrolase family 3 C-terminal domain-containing protein [Prevotellaceae bacterium]|nr:glycoside hydrolase family 3 C-terminal domain-containing protein [Prevotellaceae bacterium]
MKKILIIAAMAINMVGVQAQTLLPYQDESLSLDVRVKDALSRMTLKEKCRLSYAQSKFTSPGCARLGIPELYMSDGPHGVRMEINWNDWGHANWTNDYCTAFPALTCLAATWNTEMAAKYGKNVGEEARYREKDILLGPGVNIYRTPLNGRNFEYMGEDPYLSGSMAIPYIQSLQKNGVAACIKHYILNDQEVFRGHVDVKVSDRALYEIYLKPFAMAIKEADPWSIMGSYNRYKGIHNTHNLYLTNEILKKELGYKGANISDWGAAHDTKQSALYGLDIEMGSYTNGLTSEANGFGYDDYYLGNRYYEMAQKGEISEDVVNDKAGRVLRLIFQTAMNTKKPFGSLNSEEHLAAAREIAQEGIIILKNDNLIQKNEDSKLLPIKESDYKNVLVVGENATRQLCPGGGSSELKPKDEVSPLRGLTERFKNWNITYAEGYKSGPSFYGGIVEIPASVEDSLYNDAVEKAKNADLIIYIGGLNKNHFEDCEGGDRLSYNLSFNQDRLISALASTKKKMITIITSGNAVAMPWLKDITTLVQSWYLGSEAGHALADVLSGDVCASGKTVFSYAEKLEDYPSHKYGLVGYPGVEPQDLPEKYQYGTEGQPKSADLLKEIKIKGEAGAINTSKEQRTHHGKGNEVQVYAEDVLVGYRYFETMKQKVVFPFGYGLSYTTFAYSDATITDNGNKTWTTTISVKNTGKCAGKEVVQLYVGDDKASVVRPTKELKGFQKIMLQPGEQKTVSFTITEDDLKFFDETKHEWVSEAGTFKAYIGNSSRDVKAKLAFKL